MANQENKINNFEQQGTVSNLDRLERNLETSTTVTGLLRHISENILFKENSIKGIERFPGIVLSKIETTDKSLIDTSLLPEFKKDVIIVTYRVRVPSLHGMLPIPSKIGLNADEKDKKIIDLYPEFTCDIKKASPQIGDYVFVSFKNLETLSGGEILANAGGVSNFQATDYTPPDNKENVSQKQSEPIKPGKKNILFIGDSHTIGAFGKGVHALLNKEEHKVLRIGWIGNQSTTYLKILNNEQTSVKNMFISDNVTGVIDGTADLAKKYLNGNYDIAIIALGTNDVVTHNGNKNAYTLTTQKNLQLVNFIKQRTNNVIFVGPPDLPTKTNGLNKECNKALNWPDNMHQMSANISLQEGSKAFLRAYVSEMVKLAASNRFTFINSINYTVNKHNNCNVHYNDSESQDWIQNVFKEVSKLL